MMEGTVLYINVLIIARLLYLEMGIVTSSAIILVVIMTEETVYRDNFAFPDVSMNY